MNPSNEYDRRRKAEVLAQIKADRHTSDNWFLANRSRPAALRRLAERGQIVFSADGWQIPEPKRPTWRQRFKAAATADLSPFWAGFWSGLRVRLIGEQHE
jgi:hypothetical protein